jgi:hypothetical protein
MKVLQDGIKKIGLFSNGVNVGILYAKDSFTVTVEGNDFMCIYDGIPLENKNNVYVTHIINDYEIRKAKVFEGININFK